VFQQLVPYLVEVVVGLFGFLMLQILNRAQKDMHKLTESVDALNIKIAAILARIESHEKRIDRLEERL
jgi:hypothetical protein